MMKFRLIFMIFGLSWLMISCSFKYIDKPQPTEEDRWVKQNITRWQVKQELIRCGFNRFTWSVQQQISIDNCMLNKGFTFIDSPYGAFGSICKYPDYKNTLPSCLSMEHIR
jgi:hypothetical protein